MPVGSEIHGYIVLTSTRFASGESSTAIPLWINKHPQGQPDTSVAIFESGGVGPTYNFTGVTVVRPNLQIISRSSAYQTARDNAEHIWQLLASVTGVSIAKTTAGGTTDYMTVTPLQSPTDIGQDAEARSLVTSNYSIEKDPS